MSSRCDKKGACRTEFEAAWQKLVAATDWQQLAQCSQHLSDDQIGYFLSQTDVCHAAQLCYLDDDCHVRQSFAPESVTELLLEQAGSAMDAAAKQLIQGAFARGEPTWCCCIFWSSQPMDSPLCTITSCDQADHQQGDAILDNELSCCIVQV